MTPILFEEFVDLSNADEVVPLLFRLKYDFMGLHLYADISPGYIKDFSGGHLQVPRICGAY